MPTSGASLSPLVTWHDAGPRVTAVVCDPRGASRVARMRIRVVLPAFLEGFFLDIYTARATTTAPSPSSSRECWPSRTSRRPRTAGLPGRLPRPRHHRPPPPDHRADPCARRRPRLDRAPGALPRRGRAGPRRPLRGHGRGGPPALPGDPGPVERPGRRLLAPARGARRHLGGLLGRVRYLRDEVDDRLGGQPGHRGRRDVRQLDGAEFSSTASRTYGYPRIWRLGHTARRGPGQGTACRSDQASTTSGPGGRKWVTPVRTPRRSWRGP